MSRREYDPFYNPIIIETGPELAHSAAYSEHGPVRREGRKCGTRVMTV